MSRNNLSIIRGWPWEWKEQQRPRSFASTPDEGLLFCNSNFTFSLWYLELFVSVWYFLPVHIFQGCLSVAMTFSPAVMWRPSFSHYYNIWFTVTFHPTLTECSFFPVNCDILSHWRFFPYCDFSPDVMTLPFCHIISWYFPFCLGIAIGP
jgi:hypothetical protein